MDSSTLRHPEDGGSIFGHRPGLFVLFFTEMWERFSYYGMRVLLVVFLVDIAFGETPWERADALALYGIYTGLVYFTPMIGGILADRLLGYRKAVVLGALIMTLGHAAMAFETSGLFYTGLALLIIGNGLFKPNISSIVGQLYEKDTDRKDGAYTIFYMGINSGAFLGILLCSYYGESADWGYGYGFGLAGIFMFIGLVQFWFAQDIFGDIGLSPRQTREREESKTAVTESRAVEPEGFTVDASMTPVEAKGDFAPSVGGDDDGQRAMVWGGIGFAVAAIFYFLIASFAEPQANALQTFSREFMPPIILGAVVGFVGWIVADKSLTNVERDRVWSIVVFSFFIIFFWWAFEQAGGSMTIFALDYTERNLTGEGATYFRIANTAITVIPVVVLTWVLFKLFAITFKNYSLANLVLGLAFVIIWILIGNMLYEQFTEAAPEVPAGWFQIFNSLFIICFAPAFAKLWERKISFLRRGPIKFALGLTLLGLGFAILAVGSLSIPDGAKTASVSMFWLIAAYLFHTLGELCISPVGLSYVSKLAPVRLVGLMFGVFFVANFIANFAAGLTGSYIDEIAEAVGLSGFFGIFAAVPITAALIFVAISGWMKKMMHGIE
ncbi:POT family proton-dependent oligopeptide transporter [Neolewinella xylanilytica]|uniref:POT family proton-dependent oligopeptide transporter n=1 Tax=Neolewinella xylanilytica TaxID=1514080 RepID=A0A2S6I342_9BACT|nr:peptide MFS transporter [Neolewinella xylanilytica]PPK85489.1 POT family proton-dependent oligopeptide transporter [Neolewinella xylanilytica]